jgi:hypothetical protein
MGGIESSRFFLQPEFPGLPWRRSGLLGRHFQDHIIVSVARIEPADSRRFRAAFANVFSHGYKYQPKIRLSRSQQQQHGILNVAALVFFHGDSDAVGVQLQTTAKKLLRGRIAETFPRELAHLVRNAPCLPGRAGLMPLPIVLTYHPTPKWNWTSIANSRPRVPVQSPSVKPPIGLGCSVLVSTGTYQTSRSALFAPALKSPPNHYER